MGIDMKRFLRLILIVIICLIIIGVGLFYFLFQIKEPNELEQCMENYKEIPVEYMEEEIVVSFAEGVSEKDASDIVSNYGLEIKDNRHYGILHFLTISVPIGSETEWICKILIDKNEEIEGVTLNFLEEIQ